MLVIAGQHGNEESGRLVALSLIDWLLTRAAAPTLRRQKIVIMPNANPDGAELDSHANADGVMVHRDHAKGGAETPEGIAVEKVANALKPEVLVDLHARGFAGCSYDMVLYPAMRPYAEDENVVRRIADEMVAAGEACGIPHVTHPLTWPGWDGPDPDQPKTPTFAYREFKSLVFLTENCESNAPAYSARMRARAGVARIKAVLKHGNRRHPQLYYSGFPCMLVTGMFQLGVVAVGRTAAQRRESRISAWRNVDAFKTLRAETPELRDKKVVKLEYSGEPLRSLGIQVRSAGTRAPTSVEFGGIKIERSETDGYYNWSDGCSSYTVVAIRRLKPGQHEITVEF